MWQHVNLANKLKVKKKTVFEYLKISMININKSTDQEMVSLIADWMMENYKNEGLEILKEDG